MQWISKTPGKVAPVYNIVMIFDLIPWILILISMLTVSLSLLIASSFGLEYGVGTKDKIHCLMVPFGTLNAEYLPSWFDKKIQKSNRAKSVISFISPGFSGNFILLLWAVMGSFIAMAFLCNFRGMLMKPIYENPIDGTKDIFDSGMNKISAKLYQYKAKTPCKNTCAARNLFQVVTLHKLMLMKP